MASTRECFEILSFVSGHRLKRCRNSRRSSGPLEGPAARRSWSRLGRARTPGSPLASLLLRENDRTRGPAAASSCRGLRSTRPHHKEIRNHVIARTGCGAGVDRIDHIGPVSYTHLDVYKRQVLGGPKSFVCLRRFAEKVTE